jgi:hypothetical protein
MKVTAIGTAPDHARLERRARLAEAVARMAIAIAYDDVTPTILELETLAAICDDHELPGEAARVRRWLTE